MVTVAVLGTGLLGSGFVESLLGKGHSVRVWNRSAGKAKALEAKGATASASPAEAVGGAERVHLVLSADDAVDAVIEQLRPSLGTGVAVIDHSTNEPERTAARTEELRTAGGKFRKTWV